MSVKKESNSLEGTYNHHHRGPILAWRLNPLLWPLAGWYWSTFSFWCAMQGAFSLKGQQVYQGRTMHHCKFVCLGNKVFFIDFGTYWSEAISKVSMEIKCHFGTCFSSSSSSLSANAAFWLLTHIYSTNDKQGSMETKYNTNFQRWLWPSSSFVSGHYGWRDLAFAIVWICCLKLSHAVGWGRDVIILSLNSGLSGVLIAEKRSPGIRTDNHIFLNPTVMAKAQQQNPNKLRRQSQRQPLVPKTKRIGQEASVEVSIVFVSIEPCLYFVWIDVKLNRQDNACH